jgi:hypothetical protein
MKKFLLAIGLICLAISFQMINPGSSAYAFGEDWTWAKCPKCNKYYKHTGTDIYASPGKKVYFTEHMYFVTKGSDGVWKSYIVARDKKNTYTYVIWHLTGIPSFKSGEDLYNKFIGYVADLTVTKDHVHIGFRNASYNTSLSIKGALPRCNHKPQNLPQFPEKFDTPYVKIKIK